MCGFGLAYPPDDFVICPSCGVEFGYETAGRSFSVLRDEWIASGARWASHVVAPPPGWDAWNQLTEAGYIYFDVCQLRSNVAFGEAHIVDRLYALQLG